MYSRKIEEAIRAAAILHSHQLRRGQIPIPYISHLMSVALIVEEYGGDETSIISSLLHDTIEDTDYTEKELEHDFGTEVHEIVVTLTEPKIIRSKKLSRLERKKRYAEQLKRGPEKALLISAADKLHNFRSIVEDYSNNYDLFLSDFGPNNEDRLQGYQAIANVINSRLKNDILHEFNQTFTEFKNFLIDVEKSQNSF
jgi:(p)ppGpp synthase/HD superfamily hydrolase